MDLYRVNLFKKELRNMLGADWIRFYYSKDKSNICIREYDFGEKNIEKAIRILEMNKIDHKVKYWNEIFGFFKGIHSINIPIDQEALPERKRKEKGAKLKPKNGWEVAE